MIKWTSRGKEGDPIPWPFKPFCCIKTCQKNTEFVLHAEYGFKGAQTFCYQHKPTFEHDNELSRKITHKESENILKVKNGQIKESELLNKSYTDNIT